jgi:HlyD family secretion protein
LKAAGNLQVAIISAPKPALEQPWIKALFLKWGTKSTADPENPDDALQASLFIQRKAFYETSLRNYDAQIASAQANLKTSQDEEPLMVQRLETLRSIEAMREGLMEKQSGSRLNFLLSHDARLEVENNLSRARGNQVYLIHRLEKVRAEQQVFIEDFGRTAYQELVDTLAKRNAAAEDLKKAELRRQLIVLTAPVDSVVLEIANRSVGSVVREAETLFVLVPRAAARSFREVPDDSGNDGNGRNEGRSPQRDLLFSLPTASRPRREQHT